MQTELESKYKMKDQSNSHRKKLLSERELEVLYHISLGFTNPEIAKKILLSKGTIATYRNNILAKLSAKNSADMIRVAIEQKILVLDMEDRLLINPFLNIDKKYENLDHNIDTIRDMD